MGLHVNVLFEQNAQEVTNTLCHYKAYFAERKYSLTLDNQGLETYSMLRF